jgi:hypothetical protein
MRVITMSRAGTRAQDMAHGTSVGTERQGHTASAALLLRGADRGVIAMVVAVAVGVGCVLLLAVGVAALRYFRRPSLEPLDPAGLSALPSEPRTPQIRILRSPEELDAAIERASTTEAALAEMASKRAARYSRFGGPRAANSRNEPDGPRVTRLRIGDDPTPPATGTAEPGI